MREPAEFLRMIEIDSLARPPEEDQEEEWPDD